jgi:TPR repeat protein
MKANPGCDVLKMSGSLFVDRLVQIWAKPGKVGTGVVFGGRGILTARHVVEGALNDVDGIRVRIVPTGAMETTSPEWVSAQVCAWTHQKSRWDVALLQVGDDVDGWVVPWTLPPVIVALDNRPEPGCHSVGFPTAEVQIDQHDRSLRQTKSVVGTLLPASQARAPVTPNRRLPPRWMVLDIDTTPPLSQEQWSGMSGAPVVLPEPDGRVAAIVSAASAHTRELFVVSLSDVLSDADGFATELERLGASTVVEHRYAPRYRAALMLETLEASGRPRRVGEQDSLVAFGVKRAETTENGGFLTYVMRDGDKSPESAGDEHIAPGLRDVLREAAQPHDTTGGRVVLLTGSAAAGKSRSAAEAAIAELGTRTLLRPIPGPNALQDIRQWPTQELRDAVVWLDDVELYAEPGLAETFVRLLGAGAVVVATIRTAELETLTNTGELQNPAGKLLTNSDLVTTIRWKKNWSDTECAEAQDVLKTPAALEAVAAGKPLGVWAVAGPALVEKLRLHQHNDDHPEVAALVRLILDWYRTGYTRGLPRSVAETLFARDDNAYTGSSYSIDEIDSAIQELTKPVFGSTRDRNALVVPEDNGEVLRVHDYIRDSDASIPRQIPSEMWSVAQTEASDADLDRVIAAAYRARVLDVAIDLITPRAKVGQPGAQFNLGLFLNERGDVDEAEAWYRQAADAGDPRGLNNLGVQFEKRIGLEAAETWYRQAATAGDVDGQSNLGRVLNDRGDIDEAEIWWRQAASAGQIVAQNNLAALLSQRGDVVEAEIWWRQSAAAGHDNARTNLGALLAERGDFVEAETWYRQAAANGHTDAQFNMGTLLSWQGETVEAEMWYRQAAAASHTGAQNNLGALLLDRNEPVEAEKWFRQAAEVGQPAAAFNLGSLLNKRREVGEAEQWWRQAAAAGHTDAQSNLGLLLLQRGESVEAETWCRQAAIAGDAAAQNNLGVLLSQRGDNVEAQAWWRKAAAAGQTSAQSNLDELLSQRSEVVETEKSCGQGANAGDTDV